jgi:hypothetical protein
MDYGGWFPKLCVVRSFSIITSVFLTKSPSGRQPGFLHPISKFDTPMHTLHIDRLGSFVLSKRRNAYLNVAGDGFTKFVFLRAVRSTQRGPVLRFLDELFNLFGVVRRIRCPRGSCCTSKCISDDCKQVGYAVA